MSLLFLLLATAAAVQPPAEAPAAPLAGPPVISAPSGVTIYPSSFFVSAQPTSALDMINRVPGFSYDGGDSVRGFAGAASNVLIDGSRPASKSDSTDSILSRIPASDVDHIELIRGGAPGIDMQGRTVMANVIRKKGSTSKITASLQDNIFLNDGRTIPGGSLLYSGRFGPRTVDLGLSRYSSLDDSGGNGRITTIPAVGPQTTENARTVGHGGGVGFTAAYSGPDLGGQLRGNFKLEETYFNNGLSYGLPPTVVVNDHSRGRDGEIGATYERKLGGYDLEITGLQHLERDSATEVATVPGDNAFFGQNTRTGESILRGTVRYALNPSLNLEAGGEGAYNFLVSDLEDQSEAHPGGRCKVRILDHRGERRHLQEPLLLLRQATPAADLGPLYEHRGAAAGGAQARPAQLLQLRHPGGPEEQHRQRRQSGAAPRSALAVRGGAGAALLGQGFDRHNRPARGTDRRFRLHPAGGLQPAHRRAGQYR
jgi:hypothetical protein